MDKNPSKGYVALLGWSLNAVEAAETGEEGEEHKGRPQPPSDVPAFEGVDGRLHGERNEQCHQQHDEQGTQRLEDSLQVPEGRQAAEGQQD